MIRNRLVFLILSIILAVLSIIIYAQHSQNISPTFQLDAVVRLDRVVDGDTVWVASVYGFKKDQRFRVRLADIDSHERGQQGYEEAKQELNRILQSASCIVLDVDSPPYDRYGRVVAIVYVLDSPNILLNVNSRLVKGGFAQYVDFSGSFHPEDFKYFVEIPADLRSILARHCP